MQALRHIKRNAANDKSLAALRTYERVYFSKKNNKIIDNNQYQLIKVYEFRLIFFMFKEDLKQHNKKKKTFTRINIHSACGKTVMVIVAIFIVKIFF